MKKKSTGFMAAVFNPRIITEKHIINISGSTISVDSRPVAQNFSAFVGYCKLNHLKQSDFKSWPFEQNLDAEPVGFKDGKLIYQNNK